MAKGQNVGRQHFERLWSGRSSFPYQLPASSFPTTELPLTRQALGLTRL